jgi:RNA polymerase sigma factor (TIGR02999 family)
MAYSIGWRDTFLYRDHSRRRQLAIGHIKKNHMGEFTLLLSALRDGTAKADAVNGLFTAAYQELRTLARQRLSRSEPITTLETTVLVHEAYLRFVRVGKLDIVDRKNFMAYAAKVMRNVIIDTIREKNAARRGSGMDVITLNTEIGDIVGREEDMLHLDDALKSLEKVDPELVKIVEMRYFAGLSVDEVADALGKSPRTIFREWEKARMILLTQLQDQ